MTDKQDAKIDQLISVLQHAAETETGEVLESRLSKALGHRHYRVVAVAAKICEERFVYSQEKELVKAFRRLLNNPVKKDPNCIAKNALIRALTAIDCADVVFYLDALHYRQMEPVWGGSVDTAVDIRGSAAMGLANTDYPRAAMELAPMLTDPEVPVRRQVVQAMAVLRPEQAEPLLRLKAVTGDEESEVTAEVLGALVRMEPEMSAPFVAGFMDAEDAVLVESAVLALGDASASETLEPLINKYEDEWIQLDQRRLLIRGIALHRHQRAMEWLLEQLTEGSQPIAVAIIETLAEFRHNEQVRQQIQVVIEARNEVQLSELLSQIW